MIYDATKQRLLKPLPWVHVEYQNDGMYRESGATDTSKVPSVEHLRHVLADQLADPDEPAAIIIDDESRNTENVWSTTRHLTAAQLEANRDHCRQVARNARLAAHGRVVGMWHLGTPRWGADPKANRSKIERLSAWFGYGRDARGMIESQGAMDELHVAVPVGYSYSGEKSFAEWSVKANQTIRFSRRWNKPILFFVSPFYATTHTQPVPYFGDQLRWCESEDVDACVWTTYPKGAGDQWWIDVCREAA